MSALDDLREDRAVRKAAKGVFDADLAQVKEDFAARGIAGRIGAEARNKALAAADQSLQIASEHKGVVAGTVAALGLWFARQPIKRAIEAAIARFTD